MTYNPNEKRKEVEDYFDDLETKVRNDEIPDWKLESLLAPAYFNREEMNKIASNSEKMAEMDTWAERSRRLIELKNQLEKDKAASSFKPGMTQDETIRKMSPEEFKHYEQGTTPSQAEVIAKMSKEDFRKYETGANLPPPPVEMSGKERLREEFINSGINIAY